MTTVRNVYRLRSAKAYIVRMMWCQQVYAKCFYDSTYGGASDALEAAIAWRDQVSERLGRPVGEQISRPDGSGAAPVIRRRVDGDKTFYEVMANGRLVKSIPWEQYDSGLSAYLEARAIAGRLIASNLRSRVTV